MENVETGDSCGVSGGCIWGHEFVDGVPKIKRCDCNHSEWKRVCKFVKSKKKKKSKKANNQNISLEVPF